MCSLVVDCYDIIYMHSKTCRVGGRKTFRVCVCWGGVKEMKWGRVVGITMCYIIFIFCKFVKIQRFGVYKQSKLDLHHP